MHRTTGNDDKYVADKTRPMIRSLSKQSARIAINLINSLNNLRKLSRKKPQTEFAAPVEIERKNKRFEEFLCSGRRTLFSLKTELSNLSQTITYSNNYNCSTRHLRMLLSSSRICLHLLQGLEKFPNEIYIGKNGYQIAKEASVVAHKLILLMTLTGAIPAAICPHNQERKGEINSVEKIEMESSSSSCSTSINISTSDLDSEVAEVLDAQSVRKKLSQLAETHLKKNKNKKKQKISFKIIQPLKGNKEILTEELADGRRVQFVHDTLSPKLQKKVFTGSNIPHRRKMLVGTDVRKKENFSHSAKEREISSKRIGHGSSNSYNSVSEKMADAVFERILPYVRGHKREPDIIERADISADTAEINEAVMMKLHSLIERLDAAKIETGRMEEFAAGALKETVHSGNNEEEVYTDLKATIKKANESLQRVTEINFPPYSDTYSGVTAKILHDMEDSSTNRQRLEKPVKELYIRLNSSTESDFVTTKQLANNPEKSASKVLSMQEEILNQKIEFWSLLVENNYLKPHETSAEDSYQDVKYLKQSKVHATQDLSTQFDAKKVTERESKETQVSDLLINGEEENVTDSSKEAGSGEQRVYEAAEEERGEGKENVFSSLAEYSSNFTSDDAGSNAEGNNTDNQANQSSGSDC